MWWEKILGKKYKDVRCTRIFRGVFFQLPQFSKQRPSFWAYRAALMRQNDLIFSTIFFKICRFCSSILLSLYVFIPWEAPLESSSLTVARFSWANQNSFATHSNQWDCFNCIDIRLSQMPFCVFIRSFEYGAKAGFQMMSKYFEFLKKLFSVVFSFFII